MSKINFSILLMFFSLFILGPSNNKSVKPDNSTRTISFECCCRSGENARWYSGSGIYRHTWLTLVNPAHMFS